MAKTDKSEVDAMIDKEIARGDDDFIPDPESSGKKREPTYVMAGDSKIPVSKAHGALWKSRRDQATAKRKDGDYVKAWDEALRYYRNDQTAHRAEHDDDDMDYPGNDASKMGRRFSETENIVFANTAALVPLLYAKNPTAEFTALDQDDEVISVTLEALVARILSKKSSPGINLKPKVRKSVVMCTLANAAYIEVGYTFKEVSSDAALEDIAKLSKDLEKAKTPQAVEDIEGRIEALENAIDVLRPAGPWAKYRRPHDVIVDTDSVEDDHSDARWLMICDYLPTVFLNARFTKTKGAKRVSAYKPTHVIKRGDGGSEGHNAAEQEINNASLFVDDAKKDGASYGYDDEGAYQKAQRTKVWWVWDKITRRCLLYTDTDWTWPVWVWDDPYRLQGFFPVYKLQFYTDPEEPMSKGEVTYYLDQQDSINQINSEHKQARQWARRSLFYDKNKVNRDEVEKFIKGDEDTCVGIDVPEGMGIGDMVQSILPPSMQFVQLFDKAPILEAIDRISSVQPVQRGVEFKTNTTNGAINQYNSIAQTRTDEKIDAVEDFIGQISWAIAQMCLQFMTIDEVAMLIGNKQAQGWKPLDAGEISKTLQMTVVGGSTQKPTAESKKQQAMQMGQVLGQFVNAAPQPVLLVLLNTMRQAFNDVIPDAEWRTIMDSVASGGQTAAPGGEGEQGDAPPQEGAPEGLEQVAAELEALIDGMPPEAKKALGDAMSQGVPVRKALEGIMQMIQQQPQAA